MIDTKKPGKYSISRICLYYKFGLSQVELVSSILDPTVGIEVVDTPSVLTMSLEEEKLFTGIDGTVNFNILVGSRPLRHEQLIFCLPREVYFF